MNSVILETRNLNKSFDQGLTSAINDISLKLSRGKLYALVGPSGCGKTTLLNCIGNLDTVDSGTIHYSGKPKTSIRSWPQFRREFLGFIFQFHYLLPALTLQENVELALQPSNTVSRREKKTRVQKLLHMAGLDHIANRFAENVSGGERQRTAIARAFVNTPELILADEPTGNVDSTTSAMILDHMKAYVRKENKTILIATHDPVIEAIADEVISMKDGEITQSQPF